MNHVNYLRCLICDEKYAPDEVDYVCPHHGNEGILDVSYDYERIARETSPSSIMETGDYSIWRYKPLLPVRADSPVPPLSVGWTPLYETAKAAARLGLRRLWIKDDGRQPTASFKDRASALAVVKAWEKGAEVIATASTGNAAAALSGLCASVGQRNFIFVPDSAPEAKIAQLLAYGSVVMLVRGTYDEAFELCLEAAAEYGWYNRNTAYNPYMSEGKKTASYEICEQLNWNAPDVIFVSVGDGCIIGGLHKGLKDLLSLGWIDHLPRIIGVQAEGSSYMYEAWKNDEDVLTKPAIVAHTAADSISAGLPRDRLKAMAAVKETDGAYVSVTDEEILAAIPTLARDSGVFAEPAGAAAYAGLLKAVEEKVLLKGERIVVLNSGSGLKDIAGVMRGVNLIGTVPYHVDANMNSLKSVIPAVN